MWIIFLQTHTHRHTHTHTHTDTDTDTHTHCAACEHSYLPGHKLVEDWIAAYEGAGVGGGAREDVDHFLRLRQVLLVCRVCAQPHKS
jgi:hypothetical protein